MKLLIVLLDSAEFFLFAVFENSVQSYNPAMLIRIGFKMVKNTCKNGSIYMESRLKTPKSLV